MARLARATLIGHPHHVVQRGNYDQPVFLADADYICYLEWLREYASRYAVDIWAYCLMPNHVHMICIPKAEGALASAFNTLHMCYAQYFNGKRGVRGHLWRGRFMSCLLDEQSVREEVRFIENNPVRLGLAVRPEAYPWSSARTHVTNTPDPVLSDGCFLGAEVRDWSAYLASKGDESIIDRVRTCLKTGRPAGSPEFVHRLEGVLGRRLEALPRGRPRKSAKSAGIDFALGSPIDSMIVSKRIRR